LKNFADPDDIIESTRDVTLPYTFFKLKSAQCFKNRNILQFKENSKTIHV